MNIFVPELLPYLLAILGLLLIWQVHHMQVVAGRIQAKNLLDRSGLRMFLYVTPEDDQTCPACREAHGTIVLPALAAKKKYTPRHGSCTNPAGCRCQMIGLRGGWPEAQRLLSQAMNGSQKTLKVPPEKLTALIQGPWRTAPSAKADQISMHMLQAIHSERTDAQTAVDLYALVIDKAKAARDLPYVFPAYFRLLDLLERFNRTEDALAIIRQLDKEIGEQQAGRPKISAAQEELLSLRRIRLAAAALRPF